MNSQGVTTVMRVHPLGTMTPSVPDLKKIHPNVYEIFHGASRGSLKSLGFILWVQSISETSRVLINKRLIEELIKAHSSTVSGIHLALAAPVTEPIRGHS